MDWENFAWLKRGKRRKSILNLFFKSNKPLSVNDIRKKSRIAISQASAIITELSEKKMITCLNQKDKIGKLFIITDLGKNMIENLEGKE